MYEQKQIYYLLKLYLGLMVEVMSDFRSFLL